MIPIEPTTTRVCLVMSGSFKAGAEKFNDYAIYGPPLGDIGAAQVCDLKVSPTRRSRKFRVHCRRTTVGRSESASRGRVAVVGCRCIVACVCCERTNTGAAAGFEEGVSL